MPSIPVCYPRAEFIIGEPSIPLGGLRSTVGYVRCGVLVWRAEIDGKERTISDSRLEG